jgi:hypothetical protein
MRNAVQLVAIFFLSALATVALVTMRIGGGPERARSIAVTQSEGGDTSPSQAPPPRLVATEHLREAQDQYLKILQGSPGDAEAFRGLVAVRRQLAREDAAALREQAAAYRQLIARGGDAPGHYSRESMERLASASLQAAKAIDAERRTNPARTPMAPAVTGPGTTAPPASLGSIAEGPHVAPQAPIPPAPAPKPPAPLGPHTPSAATAPATAPAQPMPPPAPSPTGGSPASPQPPPPPGPPAAPASVQPSSVGDPSAETVAVVSPPADPALMEGQGSLVKVDCQNRTFMLRGSAGDEEYLVPPIVAIYVRGVRSERLQDFCGLQRFLGQKTVAWSTMDGDRRVARWVSVLLPAGGHRVAPGTYQESVWWGLRLHTARARMYPTVAIAT